MLISQCANGKDRVHVEDTVKKIFKLHAALHELITSLFCILISILAQLVPIMVGIIKLANLYYGGFSKRTPKH